MPDIYHHGISQHRLLRCNKKIIMRYATIVSKVASMSEIIANELICKVCTTTVIYTNLIFWLTVAPNET